LDFRGGGGTQSFDGAEVLQQRGAAHRTKAGKVVEDRLADLL